MLRRVLIVGAGKAGSTLARIIGTIKPAPFIVVGMIDDDLDKQGQVVEGFPILGTGNDLLKVIGEQNITDIIFSISVKIKDELFRSLVEAEEAGIEISTMPQVYEELIGRVPIFLLQSDWLLRSFVDQYHTNGFYDALKRLIDIIGGSLGAIIFIILFPLISILILAESGSPVIFEQTRLGKSGKEYTIGNSGQWKKCRSGWTTPHGPKGR